MGLSRRSSKFICVRAAQWQAPVAWVAPGDAVVTVILASPYRRMTAPRWVSTVWTRDSGAMRWSRESQPVCTNTLPPATSHRVRR